MQEQEIRTEMESIYFGPLRLTQAVLPYMRQRRYGVIVNMSSGASLEARDSMGAYAGAKAALDSTLYPSTPECPSSSNLQSMHRLDQSPS